MKDFCMVDRRNRIFILVNGLNITCGVSSHLFFLLKEMGDFSRQNIILIAGGGNATERYRDFVNKLFIEPSVKHENRSISGFSKGVARIRQLIKQFNPVIIHSHHFYCANIAAFSRIGLSVKTLQSVHGLIPEKGILRHYHADTIIAANEHIAGFLNDKFKKPDRIKLVRYGYPFERTMQKQASNEKIKVIIGSRLISDKGIDTFLKAVALLGSQSAGFTLDLAGGGAEESQFRDMGSNLPVNFLGELPDLINTFESYDVLINPTRSEMEGFPTVVIQAASKKLAVVSTKFRGYESCLNEKNSLLVNVDDARGIADVLLILQNNRKLLHQKQEKIFEDFLELFDIRQIAQKMIALYSDDGRV